MDKKRQRLLICLVIIFGITIVGVILTILSGTDSGITSSLIGSDSDKEEMFKLLCWAFPSLIFIGFMIGTILYLEKTA